MAWRQLIHERRRFGRFAVVGVANTVLDAAVFAGLVIALDAPPVPANVAAFGLAMVNSFLLNRAWTFGAAPGAGGELRRFLRFARLGSLVAVFSTLVLWGLVAMGVGAMAAKAVAVALSLGLNYYTASRLVFGGAGTMERLGARGGRETSWPWARPRRPPLSEP